MKRQKLPFKYRPVAFVTGFFVSGSAQRFRFMAFLITHSHFSGREISRTVSGWWLSVW
ncbi:hypothetical protein QEW03_002645 [Salmonella enterica]|nr:hypothetical protein [Salmonella enterica subsp. diarizonae]EDR4608722.1 hypothetical protein [Salmonella enterica]EDR5777337.1 hypothetical protein [Salmonella enterica subsp. enterica serovar Kokomlemle]EED8463697.1 hypothetical protein [Salmonella enterica subsp. diarizonae serovar 61:i:z53]EIG1170781.1 hypothetical protein [Salmonella enterica subsp. diarizonae serovar 48:k:z53]